MSDVTNQFMKTGLKELIHFARGLQYIKPFIKMILGDESTTEMSRNRLSAFSTSVVFLRSFYGGFVWPASLNQMIRNQVKSI